MAYNPTLGRWMQQDPMGYVDGISLYGALRHSPTSVMDPSGLVVSVACDTKEAGQQLDAQLREYLASVGVESTALKTSSNTKYRLYSLESPATAPTTQPTTRATTNPTDVEREIVAGLLRATRVFTIQGGTLANLKKHVAARRAATEVARRFADHKLTFGKGAIPNTIDEMTKLSTDPKGFTLGCTAAGEAALIGGSILADGDAAQGIAGKSGLRALFTGRAVRRDELWIPGDLGWIKQGGEHAPAFAQGQNIVYLGGGQYFGHYPLDPDHDNRDVRTLNEWMNTELKGDLADMPRRDWPSIGLDPQGMRR